MLSGGLGGADEGADDSAARRLEAVVGVGGTAAARALGIGAAVNIRDDELDAGEAGRSQLPAIFALFERAGDATGPTREVFLHVGGDRRTLGGHVADGEAPARPEDAERLAQHGVLVGREVDD